ncbi:MULTISPECIES: hypothetical protein [Pantoea]|jgi:hypothetical protein|uniref:Uncharacterized protein n=1 Tax=Pantoea brenneri TaxID=472694 RepID=A0A7Y6TU80_9GAMM|nr:MULTISPECIES: hypothetical protein [Pantoea]MBZ6397562.1 hypothetical protein [Pantoea sp.]MBZ6440711.1 hypothetical protein [Pantoea sp.]NUY44183.1 hypothetical protein [Pantoea brenneri]NUY51658.1 hypothetical protein [Pantoea brenneri]NUY61952.1 hypothetical protein [Pantoea brenneri]
MDKENKYLIKPFKVGECSIDEYESNEIVIIDIISRERLLYCEPGCYLVSTPLLLSLKENNVVDLNVIPHEELNIKFSALHNMENPNKTIPRWHRIIPFGRDLNDKREKEIYLNERDELIINERIKNILMEHKEKLKRTKIYEYSDFDVDDFVKENDPKPVFKKEKNEIAKGIAIFALVMGLVAYWFFNN